MKSRNFVNALIVLVPIGLVTGPVLRTGIRSEVAHWYLAAAANAVELGKGDVDSLVKAEKAIESARAWDAELGKLPDYLAVRLRQFSVQETDLSLAEIFKDVPDDRRLQVAEQLANKYILSRDYTLAVDVMQTLLGADANQQVLYWRAAIYRDLTEASESKVVQTLKVAIATNPGNAALRVLAEDVAHILELQDDFTSTLDAYKLWLGEKHDRTATNLNSIAYARALAKVELDQALIEIDEAIGIDPDEPAYRDTRAWVYYQLGRYEEALVDADFSIKSLESPSLSNWLNRTMEWALTPKELPKPATQVGTSGEITPEIQVTGEVPQLGIGESDPPIVMLDPPKNYATRSRANNAIWSLGVLRFHRAMILEKLGRSEEAEADWKWIEENRLPPDERLH